MKLTEAQFEALKNRQAMPGVSRSKYNNIATKVDDIRFDSKSEAAYYQMNQLRILAGELSYQLIQVPFRLPGNTKYVCDFLEAYPDGKIRYVDIKGKITDTFRLKKRQVEALYPVRIVCLKRKSGYNFEELYV